MNLLKQLHKSFNLLIAKGWNQLYVAVDVHGTIFKPCYYNKETFRYYPFAKKTLQLMSKREDINLILWTSSYRENIDNIYLKQFEKDKIKFDQINENKECNNNTLACFDSKFYMDLGLDDKFGFNPYIDWLLLYLYLKIKKHAL